MCVGALHGTSHGLVRADEPQDPLHIFTLRPAPAASAAAATAPAAAGSAAQLATGTAHGHHAPAQQLALDAGSDATPWLNPLIVAGVLNVAGNNNVAGHDHVARSSSAPPCLYP